MSRDSFGHGLDTSCIKCGSPNGTPCHDCGHLVRRRGDAPLQESKPAPEDRPTTASERRTYDNEARAAIERAELMESYL